MRTIFLLLLAAAMLLVVSPAPIQAQAGPGKYPYKVTTTVAMVTDIVKQVAGDKADVTGIVGTGIDPHLYQPTASDVRQLSEAKVVFYSGLHLEGKMGDVLKRVGRNKPVVAVTEKIDPKFILHEDDNKESHDPHVWMDLTAWAKAVEAVQQALEKFDPANAAYYKTNADKLVKEIGQLNDYGVKVMATIPKESRVLITSHDAFNYFGRAYGVEVLGVQGLSTESEAGLSDINQLVDTIVKRKVKAVFIESSVSPKNIQALIEGAKARGHNVIIGGELYSDAMGEAGTYEGTYLGMLDHNLTTVARALGGEAPEKGFAGKLKAAKHEAQTETKK